MTPTPFIRWSVMVRFLGITVHNVMLLLQFALVVIAIIDEGFISRLGQSTGFSIGEEITKIPFFSFVASSTANPEVFGVFVVLTYFLISILFVNLFVAGNRYLKQAPAEYYFSGPAGYSELLERVFYSRLPPSVSLYAYLSFLFNRRLGQRVMSAGAAAFVRSFIDEGGWKDRLFGLFAALAIPIYYGISGWGQNSWTKSILVTTLCIYAQVAIAFEATVFLTQRPQSK